MLGAILIHNEAFNHAAELIDSRDFFRDAHRRIFDKMVALSERNDAIDLVTLKEELRALGRARRSRRAGLHRRRSPTACRAVANVEHYARIVKEKSTLRSLIHSANKILADAYQAEEDAGPDPRRGREGDLRDCRGPHPRGFRAAARPRAEQLRDHREAAAAQGAGHRRADRLRRSRRDDLRPAAVGPGAGGGAAVDGEDQLRAQHRAARRHPRPT